MNSISPTPRAYFRFDEARATQIAAYLIEKTGRRNVLNYTKLLKLMYMVDRMALLAWKYPAIGGRYVSMKCGPVMSETCELIREDGHRKG